MFFKDTTALAFNQFQKFDETAFAIYADLKSSTEKMYGCKNNSEISSAANVGEYISSDFSVSPISLFKIL